MNRYTVLLAGALALLSAATAIAETPFNDPNNQLWTYGYSVPAGNGIDASVVTLPNSGVDNGFRGVKGLTSACANPGVVGGPDCEDD